jgi:dTDP-4-amino-4,6-dideoxygalactose transaminase
MKVPFFDLKRQTERIRDELSQAMMEVVDSQKFVLGPAVEKLEGQIAEKLSASHAVGVASGSDALLLSLMAAGVGPGSEVIVPAFSFFSTASAAVRLGARVVFADIDFQTFQINPDQIRRRITPQTRAVVVVHLFGDCADMLRIQSIAADHGILIIEDVAQAFGARHHGRNAGTMGFCGCFSFYPTKNLSAMGDAGMIVTNDGAAAERLRSLRAHGAEDRYHHTTLGINSRLDALQAAAVSVKLKYVEKWNQRRRQIAEHYLTELDGVIALPQTHAANDAVYNQFVVRTSERDGLREHLEGHGIGTEIYYPIPLHLQPGLRPLATNSPSTAVLGEIGDYPRAEEAARTCLALPIFPELRDDEVDHVIAKVQEFCAS